MKKRLYLIIFIIVIQSFNCQKEKKEVIETNDGSNKNKIMYSIDTSSIKIPQEFTAIDPIDIFNSLYKLDIYYHSKEEFETTEEYKTRLQSLVDKAYQTPIYNNLTLDSLFTIKLEDNISFSYDADKEIMSSGIRMSPSSVNDIGFGLDIFEKDLKDIYKNFENSAEFDIDVIKEEYSTNEYWYALEFGNYSEFKKYFVPGIHYDKSLNVELHMKRDYAQEEKENLRQIATIKIIKPWYAFINRPYSNLTDRWYKLIFANIVQFWIYNYKTGEIYFKIKPEISSNK